MAQHHGAGFTGFPQPFPSMDAMAAAPFDDVINHINSVNSHIAQVHHQLHQQMHHLHSFPTHPAPHAIAPANQFLQMQNLQRTMMTHNMQLQQTMQDMINMQNAMTQAMNQHLLALHSHLPGHIAGVHQQHFHPTMHNVNNDYEAMLRLDESIKKKGVSVSDLAKLKRVKFSAKEKCKQCGICQDNFVLGTKVISLPCSHVYCEEEILTWFDQHKTCPTCRYVVENVDAR